ncbi:hypothetical protein HMPREF9021_02660 [Simonsiella muelleri ATCC 29453]|uniref:Uncharacterized protein n=1 Tax=Simonsiella muelleri ATCC 29453 TaxID=641147 RepID=U6Q1X1_9NEIS|nr:hypothetical protein HMPREF9021_02660 [Simonsiella muelleri ATCC 29453]
MAKEMLNFAFMFTVCESFLCIGLIILANDLYEKYPKTSLYLKHFSLYSLILNSSVMLFMIYKSIP